MESRCWVSDGQKKLSRVHDKAIALRPDFIEAHNNRGAGFWALNRHADAIESYARAIALKPDFASPNWNQSLCQLALGQYEAGWDLFEWRWKVGIAHPNGDLPGNRWLGETAAGGKTILIRAEQGELGEFVAVLPLCAHAGRARFCHAGSAAPASALAVRVERSEWHRRHR